ncbi:centrosomal protein POC5 isoform X2 [Ascaphus truei]|uniref:centrosomal protein POC5 isoform X2 n=1 Tax=Ascaphus truei TaxID=8439 RepID=UPI003F5A0D11
MQLMSSDEERSTSPIIPKDSDHGSSVSSDLQDEYEELLRYAVVTPKFEPHFLRQHQLTAEQTTSDKFSSPTDDVHQQTSVRKKPSPVEDIHESSQRAFSTNGLVAGTARHSSLATDNQEEQIIPQRRSFLSGMEAFSPLHSEDLSLQGSTSSSSQIQETRVTELPVSTENMNQVEDLLDVWSGNLKTNVMAELSKWRLTIIEQHKSEMKKQGEKHAEHMTQLSNQMDNLQELLQTYETSTKRKDEVISNLTHAIEKQKEKTELMRTFTHWRLQHTEARQEDYACSLADKHYRKTLVKNVWRAWHSVIESNWKDKVEQACRTRAQEICIELSNDYEAKIAQLNGAVEEARAEVERLHAERGQFEGSMKKAFMRGVCALNMEAMTMFQGRESKMDHDPPHRREELGSSPSVTFQHQAATSGHMSSSQHDIPSPYHTPAVTSEQTFAPHFGPSSASQCKDDISTPVVISATTSGSLVLPTQKLPMTRVVTSSQQKAGKTITARITARTDLAQKISKTSSNITSMGVSPPMSSVVVEKHHPVTQQTISQATAAKYPRSALQSASSISGRSTGQSGRAHHVHTSVHSIKVVD